MLKVKGNFAVFVFVLFVLAFFAIAIKGLVATQTGDENAYYYMGKIIGEGKIPYKDFFYAHPPLQIYLVGIIYGVFGFNIIALKLMPLTATLISAFFIFIISKKKFGDFEAVISSLLFLFSYNIMFNSVFSFGVELATMFFIIGIYFLLNRGNYILSGTFLALAGLTRLLTLIPIIVLLGVAYFSNKKNFVKLSLSFLIIFLLVNGAFILLSGNDYINSVYKYHLLKNLGSKENLKEYIDIVKLNWVLFSSAMLLVFIRNKKPVNDLAIASIIYLLFLFSLKRLFGFYFLVIFPLLAVIGGYSICSLYRQLNIGGKWKITVSFALLSIFFWNLAADAAFLEKTGFAGFSRQNDLADFIKSNSDKETLLFGDVSVAPLMALITGRKIALELVDTNDQVFSSGSADLEKTLNNLIGKDILFLIRHNQGISSFKKVQDFLNNKCDFLSQFHDETEGNFLIYRCK